ncbi:MAG: SMP-30/gluconolactonase/LRE family protein [Phycisphaerales bacterium]|nr:MAG: SMP-30/gluconolactonase/LRE family protein [Phycisphaerales bacterium]
MTAALLFSVAIATAAAGQVDVTHSGTIADSLQFPARLAASSGGGIYVTDQPNGQVLEYDAVGALVNIHSVPELPVGIAAHTDGRVFVSRRDGAVGAYDGSFALLGTFDPAPLSLTSPNDLAVDSVNNKVFVTDSAEHRVLVFDTETRTLIGAWGMEGSANGEFRSPQAIAYNGNTGMVYVTDTDNFRVQVFDTNGIFQFKFGYRILYAGSTEVAWFARSEGLAIDDCGNIYVTDALMGTVRAFSNTGQELDSQFIPVIEYGTDPGDVRVPCDVLIDDSDKMYVASTYNGVVEVYDVVCSRGREAKAGGKGEPVPMGPEQPQSIFFDKILPPPDNPYDIVVAMDSGTYSRELDLNRDRRVDVTDLEIAVMTFGAATVEDFLDMRGNGRDVYPYPLQAPHLIDYAFTCGRCHSMDGLPGGMTTSAGQENLCLSCHTAGGVGMGTVIPPLGQGNSHVIGVPADAGDVAGPDPDDVYGLSLHLDNGNIRCGTCHDPHELGDGGYLRDPRPTSNLCKQCHRGDGAPVDHAVGMEHGPEYCMDCHDPHAMGDNASLIKESMYSWYINDFAGGMVEPGFTDGTIGVGDGGFVDPDADEFGLCDVCHPYFDDSQSPPVPSADFLALNPPHDENMPACTTCHAHANGFEPGLDLDLPAGSYVGADVCAVCHVTEHGEWSGTIHKEAFNNLPPFAQDPAMGCVECHTVGFEQGGFEDIATTPEFAGVQCENCHGPGSDHASLATTENIVIDLTAELCGACHTDSHHPTYDEWASSGGHVNAADNSHAGSCNVCHAPLRELAGDDHADLSIECVACHDSHAQTGNDAIPEPPHDSQLLFPEVVETTPSSAVEDVTDPSRFNLCGQCHHSRGRTWDSTSRGPHHSLQANVVVGEMPVPDGIDLVPFSTSTHASTLQQCNTCHMYTAPHQTGPPEVDAITGHTWEVNFLGCVDCHEAQDAEDLSLALQAEVQFRLDAITAALGDPATWEYSCCGGPSDQSTISDDIKKARFLLKYVEGDASLGVHNPTYVRSILEAAEVLLGLPSPLMFPTSLHGTRAGKAYFYSADNGGFETITGIPMDDLDCQECHAPTYADGTPVDPATYEPQCLDCHADPSAPGPVADSICFGCHGRQNVEANVFGLQDVHRDMGFACTDCHSIGDMHGDGNVYNSQLDPGAIDADCENCHTEFEPGNVAHEVHMDTVDCSACHVSTVITCYNCHFESELAGGGKRFFAPPRQDFKFLVNFEGKVHDATIQSLVYDGQSFYTMAPYYAHAVSSVPATCTDCHGNAAVAEYDSTGQITVTEWDAGTTTLSGPTGVIPVPPDWDTSLKFDFLDYTGDASDPTTDPAAWVFLKSGADLTQMLYGEPLTVDQLDKLSLGLAPSTYSPTIVSIQQVNGGSPVEVGGSFTVDFTIEDDAGDPIAKEDLNRLRLYVSGPTFNYQRVIEVDSDLTHFAQNPDGSYTYTAVDPFPSVYAPPENDSPAFGPGDGEMTGLPLLEGTYTVLIEARRVFGSIRKAGDATMDFVVADDPGAPPALEPRQFVQRDVCNNCHNDLQIHGNNRFAVTGCLICHTAGSEDLITDPETTPGVTVKFGEMIHRIHRGHALPSVAATAHGADPYRYEIIGHGESVNDFSDVGSPVLPEGVMDCGACHGGAAQEADIYTNATRANCTSCHDDLDFATGTILDETHPDVQAGLLSEDDLDDPAYRVDIGHTWAEGSCMGCHGSASVIGVEVIHQHPTRLEQEGTVPTMDIVSVGGMTGGSGTYFVAGDFPEITFRLTDVYNDPLELVSGDATVIDRIEFIFAGPTTLYQTILPSQRPWSGGSLAVDPANWVDNFLVDGTYTFISEDPLPADYPPQLNSIGEAPADQIFPFEEGWGQLYTPAGTPLDSGTYTVFGYGRRVTPTDGEREPVISDQFDVPFGAADPLVPYGGTVTTEMCNACHGTLAFHGNQREGVLTCLACHTAGTQDGGTYESVDLRIMVHKIHNAQNLDVVQQGGAYELYGHSGLTDFSHMLISSMPGEAAECHECHVNDDWKSPPLRANMRTWMVACTSCHDSADTAAHVDAMTVPGTFEELCTVCHVEGGLSPVSDSHASP